MSTFEHEQRQQRKLHDHLNFRQIELSLEPIRRWMIATSILSTVFAKKKKFSGWKICDVFFSRNSNVGREIVANLWLQDKIFCTSKEQGASERGGAKKK